MQNSLSVENITDGQIQLLGWGTTLGIVVQALILIPVVKRSGIRLRPIFGVAGLGKSFSLAGWTLVYVLISQIGYLITVNVATSAAVRSAQAGISTGVGFTPFTAAYYIMLLPYSIVTISIVTALLPHLSKLAIDKNVDEVKKQLVRAIRMCGVVTVPSSVAFLLFGSLMTEVLYFGISLEDSRYIGYVLSALSLGLVAFSINLVLIRGFNAFEDTKTQVISILIINIVSSALAYLFLATLENEHVTIGLGLAFSISYIIGLFITIALLRRHIGKFEYSHFLGQHLRLYLASFSAMLPFFAIALFFGWVSDDAQPIIGVLRLVFVLVGGGTGFLLLGHVFKITEIAALKEFAISLLRKRKASRKR
jgi:putative peptidoglycan lipid II flippase